MQVRTPDWFDGKQATLIALALGVLIASVVGCLWLRASPLEPLQQGRRLMDSVGWAAILPQMLASLGAVFALAGVGDVVGQIVSMAIPQGSLLGAVIAYGLGMALFTMVMGNAFAAFPVMTAAIGLPLLIRTYGGDPAIVCAIGMLAGFCGTLMTPMAANFNLVPAALLDLKDKHGVNVYRTPDSVMKDQLKAWDVVVNRISSKDPFFAKVVKSQKSYAKKVMNYLLLNQPDYGIAYKHHFG